MSRRHRSRLLLSGMVCWLAAGSLAQGPADTTPQPTLRVTSGLVLVDAVVTDREGRPIRDLKAEDFQVFESGRPVKLAFASLHSPGETTPRAANPPLPPNVYTNRPEYRSPVEPLTILVLDARNTQMQDQAYARLQLLKYLGTQLKPGQPMAVYALGNSLKLLQDFTDDPAQLRAAVAAFRPEFSRELSMEDTDRLAPPLPREERFLRFHRQLREFYKYQVIAARDLRVGETLAALRAIARSMAGLPGRKNLVWVSAAFPLRSFDTHSSYVTEMMVTTALLTDARVAVYPVDARGLVGFGFGADNAAMYTVSGSEHPASAYADAVARNSQQLMDTQQSMQTLAEFTGGRVFTNRNDIDNAVATSIAEGSMYYVLGYYAENKTWDGKFRELKVSLKRQGLIVRHRKGYYAFDPLQWETRSKAAQADLAWTLDAAGVPATMVVFDARITPDGPGPMTKVPIQFRVNPGTLSPEPMADGGRKYRVEFHAVALNAKGDVAARRDQQFVVPIKSADVAALEEQGLPFHMELELAPGQYELRLGVRDAATGFFGTLSAHVDAGRPTP